MLRFTALLTRQVSYSLDHSVTAPATPTPPNSSLFSASAYKCVSPCSKHRYFLSFCPLAWCSSLLAAQFLCFPTCTPLASPLRKATEFPWGRWSYLGDKVLCKGHEQLTTKAPWHLYLYLYFPIEESLAPLSFVQKKGTSDSPHVAPAC